MKKSSLLDATVVRKTGTYFYLGAPFSEDKKKEYWKKLIAEYDENIKNAHEYVYKVNDRIINKSRGIVSFNGIFAAVALFTLASAPLISKIIFCLLILSLCLNLFSMYVIWRDIGNENGDVGDPMYKREYSSFSHACTRAFLVNISIVLSIIASLLLLLIVLSYTPSVGSTVISPLETAPCS